MKSSGEDLFASAPKQAAPIKMSEITSAWRNVMFRKVLILFESLKPRRIAANERGSEGVSNWCLKKVLMGSLSLSSTSFSDI